MSRSPYVGDASAGGPPGHAGSNRLLRDRCSVQVLRRGHEDQQRAQESIAVHWAPYVAHGAAAAMMRQVSALDVHDTLDVADQLPALRLPSRIVWGVADRFQKVHYGDRLARDLDTDLRRIPGGRHFTPEDHPEAIAAAVSDLL